MPHVLFFLDLSYDWCLGTGFTCVITLLSITLPHHGWFKAFLTTLANLSPGKLILLLLRWDLSEPHHHQQWVDLPVFHKICPLPCSPSKITVLPSAFFLLWFEGQEGFLKLDIPLSWFPSQFPKDFCDLWNAA